MKKILVVLTTLLVLACSGLNGGKEEPGLLDTLDTNQYMIDTIVMDNHEFVVVLIEEKNDSSSMYIKHSEECKCLKNK